LGEAPGVKLRFFGRSAGGWYPMIEGFRVDGRMVRACCESDPVLGYELTRRLAHVVAKRLQATRVRLITTSSQSAGEFRLEEM
jgi:hypothetical protein